MVSDQAIGIITGVFTFSALALRPYAGHALESRGRQFVYLLGLVIFVISVGSYAFIASIGLLFFMRMVQGVGLGAMIFGQLAFMFGYDTIYVTAAGSVMLSMLLYVFLFIRAWKRKRKQSV